MGEKVLKSQMPVSLPAETGKVEITKNHTFLFLLTAEKDTSGDLRVLISPPTSPTPQHHKCRGENEDRCPQTLWWVRVMLELTSKHIALFAKVWRTRFQQICPFVSRLFAAMRSIPAAQHFPLVLLLQQSDCKPFIQISAYNSKSYSINNSYQGIVELNSPPEALKEKWNSHLHLEQTQGSVLFRDVYLSWCKNVKTTFWPRVWRTYSAFHLSLTLF